MYIPFPAQSQPRSARSGLPGAFVAAATSVIRRCLDLSAPTSLTRTLSVRDHQSNSVGPMPAPARLLMRRDMSENQLRIIVAVTVAILLTAFIAASCTFMYLFRPTVRYRRRKPHHHHHHNHHQTSRKLSGSRGSHGSGSPPPASSPPPPPPPPPPPAV